MDFVVAGTSRRGMAKPGAPPLPRDSPDPSDDEDVSAQVKNIPLPPSNSAGGDSSLSDDNSDGDDDPFDDFADVDDTSAGDKSSRKRKLSDVDSDDSDHDMNDSASAVSDKSGSDPKRSKRKMFGSKTQTVKCQLRPHHQTFIERNFSVFIDKKKMEKDVKDEDIPLFDHKNLTLKKIDPVLQSRCSIPEKSLEKSDKRFSDIENRLYCAARPLVQMLQDIEDGAEHGVDQDRLLDLGEAALLCIGQAAADAKHHRRQVILGNILFNHKKAETILKQEDEKLLMDSDPKLLFGTAFCKKFAKDLKCENIMAESIKKNKSFNTPNKKFKSKDTSNTYASKKLQFNKKAGTGAGGQQTSTSGFKKKPFRKPSGGGGGSVGGQPSRYVCFKRKQPAKIYFFKPNCKSESVGKTKSAENSNRIRFRAHSSTRVSWGEGAILPSKLEGVDSGSLDPGSRSREANRLAGNACSVERAKALDLQQGRKLVGRSRSAENARSSGHRALRRRSRSICEHNLFEGQARRRQETDFQSENAKSVHRVCTFQVGRGSSSNRTDPFFLFLNLFNLQLV